MENSPLPLPRSPLQRHDGRLEPVDELLRDGDLGGCVAVPCQTVGRRAVVCVCRCTCVRSLTLESRRDLSISRVHEHSRRVLVCRLAAVCRLSREKNGSEYKSYEILLSPAVPATAYDTILTGWIMILCHRAHDGTLYFQGMLDGGRRSRTLRRWGECGGDRDRTDR